MSSFEMKVTIITSRNNFLLNSSTAGKGKKISELQLPECSQYITKDFTFLHDLESSCLLFLPLRRGKFETESCIGWHGQLFKLRCRQQRFGGYHHQGLKHQYLTGLDQKFDSVVQTSTGICQALRHPKHPEGMPDMTLYEGYDQVIHCSHLDKETIQRWGLNTKSSSFIEMRGQRGQKKTTKKTQKTVENPDLVGYINKTKLMIQPVYY
ncbi:hypothetical protein EK904_012294, partial [Melospiza melodia maxima]